jgi:hypothetical protein
VFYLLYCLVVLVVVVVVVVVAVFVVVAVVVVVLISISQLPPSKPTLQKHFVCLNLSAKHVPPFLHVVSLQGLFTTCFYFCSI